MGADDKSRRLALSGRLPLLKRLLARLFNVQGTQSNGIGQPLEVNLGLLHFRLLPDGLLTACKGLKYISG